MNESIKDKAKTASSETRKVFKAYVTALILIFVMATILSSYWGFDLAGNTVLLGAAIVIGIAIVAFQAYMTIRVRQQKKLERQN